MYKASRYDSIRYQLDDKFSSPAPFTINTFLVHPGWVEISEKVFNRFLIDNDMGKYATYKSLKDRILSAF